MKAIRRPIAHSTQCWVAPVLALAALLLPWVCLAAEKPEDVEWSFGESLYQTELYRPAAEQYEKFLKLYPQDARGEEGTFKLADCWLRLGNYDKSISVLEDLLRAYEKGRFKERKFYELSFFRLGHARFSQSSFEKATGPLEKFISFADTPQTKDLKPTAVYELALSYHSMGKLAEAVKYFRGSAQIGDPRHRERAAYLVGELELQQGRHPAAIEALKLFLKEHPKSSLRDQARLNLAHAHFQSQDYASAAAEYAQVGGEFETEARLAEFQALLLLKRYPEATQRGETFLQKFPTPPASARVRFSLAECAFQTRNWERCAHHAAALLAMTQPENRETLLHRHAVSNYYLDKPQLCIDAGTQLLKDYPKSQHLDDAHFVIAESHFKLSQWESAVRHYSQVSEGTQFHKLAKYQLARSYDQAGQKDKAAAAYRKYFDVAPKEQFASAALFRAAALYQELKAFAQAVELYALYERAFPAPVTPQLRDARYQRAVCLLALEKHDEMLQTFKAYLKDYPDADPRTRGNATYWIGWYYLQKEQSPSKAVVYFQQASALGGDFQSEALYRLAESHYVLAQQAEKDKNEALARPHHLKAAEAYLDLAKRNPELIRHANFYTYTAAVFRSENRFPEAIRTYELLLKAFPQDAGLDEVYFYLGELHSKLQPPQWPEAIRRYEKVMAYPESKLRDHALFGKSWALWKLQRPQEALPGFEKVIECRTPGIYDLSRYALGSILYDRGEFALAQPHLLYVGLVSRDSDHSPEALYKAGKVSLAKKELNDCVKTWNFLLKYFPDTPWAGKVREEAAALPGYQMSAQGMVKKAP